MGGMAPGDGRNFTDYCLYRSAPFAVNALSINDEVYVWVTDSLIASLVSGASVEIYLPMDPYTQHPHMSINDVHCKRLDWPKDAEFEWSAPRDWTMDGSTRSTCSTTASSIESDGSRADVTDNVTDDGILCQAEKRLSESKLGSTRSTRSAPDVNCENKKKEWCEVEIDKTEDNKKVLQNEISDLKTAIDDAKESITTLKAEIEALDDGIRAFDKEVGDYTEQREKEHAEYTETLAGNSAAVDLLKFAMNRLNKFGLTDSEERGECVAFGFTDSEERGEGIAFGLTDHKEHGEYIAFGLMDSEERGECVAFGFTDSEECGECTELGLTVTVAGLGIERVSKLAKLSETNEDGLRDQLMCVMHKTRQPLRPDRYVKPLSGELQCCSGVQFNLDGHHPRHLVAAHEGVSEEKRKHCKKRAYAPSMLPDGVSDVADFCVQTFWDQVQEIGDGYSLEDLVLDPPLERVRASPFGTWNATTKTPPGYGDANFTTYYFGQAEWVLPRASERRSSGDRVVFIHGGSAADSAVGDLYNGFADHLAQATGLPVFAFDFEQEPVVPWPQNLRSILGFAEYGLENGHDGPGRAERIFVIGDSEGTLTALQTVASPLDEDFKKQQGFAASRALANPSDWLAGVVLSSPGVDVDCKTESFKYNIWNATSMSGDPDTGVGWDGYSLDDLIGDCRRSYIEYAYGLKGD